MTYFRCTPAESTRADRADRNQIAHRQLCRVNGSKASAGGPRHGHLRRDACGDDRQSTAGRVEALYLAHHILGRQTEGLLDHYHWADEVLRLNGLDN